MVPYTVEGGKMNRGVTVLNAAKVLAGDKGLTALQQEVMVGHHVCISLTRAVLFRVGVVLVDLM